MQELIDIIELNKLGDIASILGLLVALIGFGITLKKVSKARSTSMQVEQAVNSVREDIRRLEIVHDFAAALTAMEEIKRLHRDAAWNLLPERYSNLRRTLISIRTDNPTLTDDDLSAIQSAITHFRTLEKQVDGMINKGPIKIDIAKANASTTTRIERLQEILVRVRADIGDR